MTFPNGADAILHARTAARHGSPIVARINQAEPSEVARPCYRGLDGGFGLEASPLACCADGEGNKLLTRGASSSHSFNICNKTNGSVGVVLTAQARSQVFRFGGNTILGD